MWLPNDEVSQRAGPSQHLIPIISASPISDQIVFPRFIVRSRSTGSSLSASSSTLDTTARQDSGTFNRKHRKTRMFISAWTSSRNTFQFHLSPLPPNTTTSWPLHSSPLILSKTAPVSTWTRKVEQPTIPLSQDHPPISSTIPTCQCRRPHHRNLSAPTMKTTAPATLSPPQVASLNSTMSH